MKNKKILFSVFICLLSIFGALNKTSAADLKETTYQRVMHSNTIRCGYTSWDPLFFVDTKNGDKKGIFHDIMEEAGKRLDIKIVWQEELGWGSVIEAIRSGRVDMACAGYWLNPARIKNAQPSISQLYSPMYVYMRTDDARSIKKPEDLNTSQYTISTIDGSAENQIVAKRFSQSKNTTLPELNSSADTIQNLLAKKADFLLLDSATATGYMAHNPGKIKNVFPDIPMTLFPTVMLLPAEDMVFKSMMDNILLDIEYDGTLDVILKRYESGHLFLRNQQPVPH